MSRKKGKRAISITLNVNVQCRGCSDTNTDYNPDPAEDVGPIVPETPGVKAHTLGESMKDQHHFLRFYQ